MQRYSLYIDHQLVSTLIRQLQTIVHTCYTELDQEYESHQLRTHIYEEFVFHLTALYNSKYAVKHEHQLKEDDMKKYYELTAKLEGIGAVVKYEDVGGWEMKVGTKGRPNKNSEAEEHLFQWVKDKLLTEGRLIYTKKELDEVYLPFLNSNKPKSFPTNNYFRIFKKYHLLDISITNRNGVQKSVREFFNKKNLFQSFCKKQDESENLYQLNEHGIDESDLNSTSELEHELEEQYDDSKNSRELKIRSAKLNNRKPFGWNPKPRTCKVAKSKKEKKAEKQLEKSMKMKDFFDEDSDCAKIDHHWDDLSMSDGLFERVDPQPDIYDNSKSFE